MPNLAYIMRRVDEYAGKSRADADNFAVKYIDDGNIQSGRNSAIQK
jgi:hypothetical protein